MTAKIGDVVAWADVPDGAMVRDADGDYAAHVGGESCWVGLPGLESSPVWQSFEAQGEWAQAAKWRRGKYTIVALGLTGQETAADLQRMAEVFEVREAMRADDQLSLLMEADGVVRGDHIEDEQV